MNDSPRTRERLGSMRSADRLFQGVRALAAVPLPVLLLVAGGTLVAGSIGASAMDLPWGALVRGTLTMAAVAVFGALPLAFAGAVLSRTGLGPRARQVLDAVLSACSAIPMVALGFLFAQLVGPTISAWMDGPAMSPGLAALAMAFGILPILWRKLLEAFDAVPRDLSRGALALGARPVRALLGVELPAAWPSVVRAIAEALARASGESVVVLMVSGNAATWWGGMEGGASLAASLLVLVPETSAGSPLRIELHRMALVLVVICVAFHSLTVLVRREDRP